MDYAKEYDRMVEQSNQQQEIIERLQADVQETLRFLEELPDDLGRGSLNGWRTQLYYKIKES